MRMNFSHCCAIVGSASFDREHFLRERDAGRFACVVAADGGFASLSSVGVEPDLALGDFDSLGYVPACSRVERHPVMKDASDLELAFEWARREGCDSVVAYGSLGGRLDQTMATCQTLLRYAAAGMDVVAVGEGYDVVALTASSEGPVASLRMAAGLSGTVSVFSMGGDASGVREKGLLYELEDAVLPCDSSLGLSNEFTGEASLIEVADGSLLAFLPSVPLEALA